MRRGHDVCWGGGAGCRVAGMVARDIEFDRWMGEQQAQGADGRNEKSAGATGGRMKPKVGTDDEQK